MYLRYAVAKLEAFGPIGRLLRELCALPTNRGASYFTNITIECIPKEPDDGECDGHKRHENILQVPRALGLRPIRDQLVCCVR